MKVIKRNGSEVDFDITKIIAAITKANDVVEESERMTPMQIRRIAESVDLACQKMNRSPSVEEIQDLVEKQIMAHGAFEVAKRYITYRYTRSLVRRSNTTDEKILSLIECCNEEAKQENSNKNPVVNSTQRDYMAGEVSRDITNRILLPPDIVEAHNEGIIHFHDSDYFAQHMHNCDLVNLEDMLQNGTVITGTLIERPHSFSTACNIATQIIAQVASNQYGGQSISLTHLAPFVQVSREKIRRQLQEEMQEVKADITEEQLSNMVEKRLRDEIRRGVQTIQYQVVTLLTTNGQAPFVTVFMYLNEAKNEQEKHDLALIIEEVLQQRYEGVKNESGVWVTPAFPKLIYVLEEDNIYENSEYYYLTRMAAKCTAKRMVPDYISEKKMLELKVDKNGEGHCYTCMGCRSFLTPYVDENGKPKYYGRFNQGVVTINLPDVALSSGGNMEKFWKIFDERLELCHRALMCRHERLKGTLSDAAPILWQYGALARLKKGEPIDKLLYGGYSTISLGYAGLYECVKYMTGKSHTDPSATPFALEIMQHMNDACAKWKQMHNIDFSLYGTPLESTTYKFAKCLQKRFGIIPGVTDKGYITNSYHIHVTEHIDAFSKLAFESKFQAFHDSRFFGRPLQLLAINSRDSRKFALQHRSDLIPFGHDVIQHDVFLFGDSETFLQQFKALAVDRHRFVGKHIDAGLKRLLYVFGLLAVVPCLDHHVPLLLGQHFFQVIISRINDFIPSRRILRTCVESLYTFQVLVHVETGGCVHINIFRNLRIRHFLH